MTIVGRDLRIVEGVTGRLPVGRAALAGAAAGAWWGLVVGLLFGILLPGERSARRRAVRAGGGCGVRRGLRSGAHALTRGRRDFSSLRSLDAGRYEVLVDEGHAERAREALGSSRT